jgi:hypothetical protein
VKGHLTRVGTRITKGVCFLPSPAYSCSSFVCVGCWEKGLGNGGWGFGRFRIVLI